MGIFSKKPPVEKNQAQAFAEFQQAIQAAIIQARQRHLEFHATNLDMAQMRR